MAALYPLLRPLAFRLDPELAHRATLRALAAASHAPGALRLLAQGAPRPDARLRTRAFGLTFPSPVGLAAGLDKDGVALPAWGALGFGALEVGTVTARPQPGNPRPRLFRLPRSEALVNRMGFDNRGAAALARQLAHWKRSGAWPDVPVGVNVGKTFDTPLEEAEADYRASVRAVRAVADYLVINVSSPNTPGLRTLQGPSRLPALLAAVRQEAVGVPVLVKVAPDLEDAELVALAGLAERHGASGLIAVNTTVARPFLGAEDPGEPGGLSGRPLAPRARAVLRLLRGATSLPLVSVGGVDGPQEAWDRLEAGATLVQLYTPLIYAGPALVARIVRGLERELDRSGAPSLEAWRRAQWVSGASGAAAPPAGPSRASASR